MLRRTLFAFLLLASPAAALDIYDDYTLSPDNYTPLETIQVYGDATLTIDGAVGVRRISLNDSSSLVMRSGQIGNVDFLGDNSYEQTGGKCVPEARFLGQTNGHSEMSVTGGEFWCDLQFALHTGDDSTQYFFQDFDTTIGGPRFVYAFDRMLLSLVADLPVYFFNPTRLIEGLPTGGTDARVEFSSWPRWSFDSSAPYLSGDANFDGVVDLIDLNHVRNLFGRDRAPQYLDTLPYNGQIDLDDLNRVRNNFGATIATPVPEPSTIALLLLGIGACALRIRRAGSSAP
jgi:hypothetical protein